MVFESLVVDLINKYLGNYIAKLDKSQLKLGLLGGNATLENLDIKENAFDEFDLPIKVVQGHIGKLTLKIPWKHLYSEPVIAELDGLYVLVIPNSGVKYDPEKDRLFKLEAKMKELTRIEEAKAKRNEPKKDDAAKDSFGEKFAAQVVKNLQINITNIHIRFEDSFTNPQRPFAVGITLANLSFQTCDSTGESIVIKDDATKEFFKSVKMDSLALYWKSQPTIFNGLTRGQMKNAMKNTISASGNKVPELNYLIQPISCSSMMHVHMKPETTNFTVPQLSLNLTVDQIGFGFTRNQYCDLATFLDSIDRVWTQSRFLKYRPSVPVKNNVRTWWLFPYIVIVEEQVRRRQRMWSWQFIRNHRIRCRTYTELWEQKLLDKKLSAEQQKTIQNCEEELDLLNITLCRQQADMKAKKAKKRMNDQKSASGGWFSGWFSKSETASDASSKIAADNDDIKKKVSDEFTNEEKMKLYQAIGYSEQSKDPDIPKEYVSLKLNVVLHKLTLLLSDESLSEKKLIKLSIHSLAANVEQRSAADAIKVGLLLSTMQMTGSTHSDGVVPMLISTQRISQGDNLLLIDFETNPLDGFANQKINIRAEPLEIIYDSDTINRLVKFVTPPEELRLYELSNQVAASLEDVKEMTATGLRHLAEQRLYTDIKVDIKPSYFIMAEGGSYKKDCKMILVDLGSIIVKSKRTSTVNSGDLNKMTKDGKLDYDSIKESAYDKFQITMSTIQVLLIEQGDDWRSLRSMDKSKSHILRPFGFDFELKKCAVTNDVNLPNIVIEGCLPSLGVTISDHALHSILDLILHVPFPQMDSPKVVPMKEDYLKGLDTSPFGIMGVELSGNQVLRAADIGIDDSETMSTVSTLDDDNGTDQFYEASEQWDNRGDAMQRKGDKVIQPSNLVDLEMTFIIITAEVQIFEEVEHTDTESTVRKEIVNLTVDEIGMILKIKRFDMNVKAYVGGLMLAVPQFMQLYTNEPVCLAKTNKRLGNEKLLFVNLMIAEKTCPDFVTFYKNTRHNLECNFKSLDICLHQEALLLLLNFANGLMVTVNTEEKETVPHWSTTIGDKEGALEAKERQETHSQDKKKVFPVTSVINVVSDNREAIKEKRHICLEAENEAARAGVTVCIPEISVTQWAVTASLEQLRLCLANESHGVILDVSVSGMRADVKMTYRTTEVGVSLTDVRVQDPSPGAMYKKIMWIEPNESIFSAQVVIFNQNTQTPGYEYDLTKVDTMVRLEMGKVKIVFLYNFVQRIQLFLESFQSAMTAVADKAQQYSQVAAQQVANVLEEPPSSRISLDIKIDAPVIHVPEHSQSTNALMIDLGSMIFKNDFQLASNSRAIVEVSDISLTNVRVSRSILLETVVGNEKGVLSPINVKVHMLRNLSWTKCNEIPQIDVTVEMRAISVKMTQGDFTMIQKVIQSNIGEVVKDDSDVVTSKGATVKPSVKEGGTSPDKTTMALVSKDKSGDGKSEVVTIQFNFQMDSMDLELFKGDISPSDWASEVPPERRLAKMNCDNLVVRGRMYLNSALEVDVSLNNIRLLDTQPGSSTKINELIRNRSNDIEDFISVKFLLDNVGNSKLFVNVAGIYVCICVDYLMQLADFFIKSQPPPMTSQVPLSSNKRVITDGSIGDNTKKSQGAMKTTLEPRPVDFEIDVHLARPEIILVEDIDHPKSNAIMVQMEVMLKYSMMKECDIINAEVKDFEATFCPFDEKKRKKYSMDIISPTKLAFYCNRPINDGMQGSLTMEHLVVNITPAVIQSVSKIVASLNAKSDDTSSLDNKAILDDRNLENNDFWSTKKFEESDYGFIAKGLLDNKVDDTIESGMDVALALADLSDHRPDKIFIRLPDIRVVIESEVAKKCVPMLILECAVDGELKNPLAKLSVDLSVALSVSYFNDNLNVWEPLVEVYVEDNKRQYILDIQYMTQDDSDLLSMEDMVDTTFIDSAAVSIGIQSRDNLELTLSKTALDVLTKLGKAFEDAYTLNLESHKSVVGSPYLIKNSCGMDVMLFLSEEFDLKGCLEDKSMIVKNGVDVKLCDAKVEKTFITDEKKARHIQLALPDNANDKAALLIHKSEIRGLYLLTNKSSSVIDQDLGLVVVQTTAYLGMKNLDVRSVLQVRNSSDDDLDLYYKRCQDNYPILIQNVLSGQTCNVPIPVLLQSDGNIYIGVPHFKTGVSSHGVLWKTASTNTPIATSTQVIECRSDTSSSGYYYSTNVLETRITTGSSEDKMDHSARSYCINICAPMSLHNQLPIEISYQTPVISNKIDTGCKQSLRISVLDKSTTIKINYEYNKRDWYGLLEIRPKMDEFGVIAFKAKEGFSDMIMELGVHSIVKDGHVSLTIYCPYWMINKTGHGLIYKADDDYVVEHEPDNNEAVLFSFLSKSMFNKKKPLKVTSDLTKTSPSQHSLEILQTDEGTSSGQALVDPDLDTQDCKFAKSVKAYLKIDNSSWSDKFSLDTVGSNGKIICKKKPLSYEIGVNIKLSSSGLTKIVTFMPYYMIINKSPVHLECEELVAGTSPISLPPGEAVPFWPRSEIGKNMLMRCIVDDKDPLVTQPFPFYETHSLLLRLDKKYVGIFVDVQITEEANLITLQLYQEGMALVQLINHLSDNVNIYYKQSGSNEELMLPPLHSVMYAWQDSRLKKELQWRVDGDGDGKKHYVNSLTSDNIGDFHINKKKTYWVSSVLEMHRVLLFTSNQNVAKRARVSTDLEKIDMEVTLSLHSIGLSLVDNSKFQELAYISITSSGIKWNQWKKKRQRPLKLAQSEALEVAFEDYMRKVKVGVPVSEIFKMDDLVVDLNKKMMLKPENVELSRMFEPGVYMQYRTSPHQMHLHMRVHRIQIDNQMFDCTFPVVFAPFPPPRSVTLETGLRPLIEVSAVIGRTTDGSSMRFKYFRVLIQEMQLMLDQGFVNALLDYLSGSVPDVDEEAMFKTDRKMIEDRLIDTPIIDAILQGGKKCVFDNFHISPIKIHLSFSLTRVSQTGKTALHSDVLNLFLQSVGIVVTDMQDVIFKLGYFEKQNSIMPMNQMTSAMTSHYVSQALRQMYVLVLGLDVLGNPFGVIRGMAQGVEDLFYEPIKGAVMGPEEFVDGVAYGVKSLFGHAVGGAAGAVSRIVGTMGKGIAALTLDEDYQRKRREQLSRRHDNVGVGLAQGGKGLIQGIVQGVTGVVTKPIDGAKKEGVEGFFKGVGKGLVGVVTRPVSGVVDFASSSFEGLRRAADTSIEVYRIRPPRFIGKDGVIRNYGLREAEGNVIWKKMVEKNESVPEEVYVFHVYCRPKKQCLMLTNERVLHIDHNDILCTWSLLWHIAYDKLDGPPTFVEAPRSMIIFTLKEKQRKMFSKDNITKEIEVDLPAIKALIARIASITADDSGASGPKKTVASSSSK